MTRDEHLMAIAAEECVEIAQRWTKALRFGPDQIQAQAGHSVTGNADESLTNRQRVLKEFADLVAVMQMLGFNIPSGSLQPWVDAKREKVERFLQYSAQVGTLRALTQTVEQTEQKKCSIHGDNCPGDSGHMFMDMNHPDNMYGTSPVLSSPSAAPQEHEPDCAAISHRRSDDGGVTFKWPAVDCTCGARASAPSGDAQKELEAALEQEIAIRDALFALINGEEVSEFMLSFAIVRQGKDAIAASQVVSTPGHGWNCLCDVCGPLLSFLNGISPSLLNTPKRNAQGEAVLSIAQSIAIANGDYTSLLDEREEMKERLEASTPAVIAELYKEMRSVQRIAEQASVEHVDPLMARADARFAEFAGRWADRLASLCILTEDEANK